MTFLPGNVNGKDKIESRGRRDQRWVKFPLWIHRLRSDQAWMDWPQNWKKRRQRYEWMSGKC